VGHANLVVFFKPCRPLPLFAYCTHAVQLGLLSTANTLCFIVFVGIASYTVGHVGPLVQVPRRALS
jgi:hypothetical protein